MTNDKAEARTGRVWLEQDGCCVADLAALAERETSATDYPLAEDVRERVLIYDCEALRTAVAEPTSRRALMAEWAEALASGPGIIVLRRMYPDHAVIDAATAVFWEIIAAERQGHVGGGDHFARPGANDRVWNALEKMCLRAPGAFAAYYANEFVALASEAWLGPAYQVTSQVNVVNPGGEAQSAHRDYHLGFQSAESGARFPAHVHRLSPLLTLQGAVAHCDMPVETGPTMYLPHSQHYLPGYLAVTRPDFRAFFAEHHVQLPLAKGDGVFFNPALFHAAGHNCSSDVRRIANLLQISSAFGRAMESVDRTRMSATLFPVMADLLRTGRLNREQAACAVAACAEGYSFPTNLDRDPPIGGLVPQTQQALMALALAEDWAVERFREALNAHATRRLT